MANAMGLTKSSISKWKETWIPKIAMLLAVLEWGVVDDDMSRLAKEVASLLRKRWPQSARNTLRPDAN